MLATLLNAQAAHPSETRLLILGVRSPARVTVLLHAYNTLLYSIVAFSLLGYVLSTIFVFSYADGGGCAHNNTRAHNAGGLWSTYFQHPRFGVFLFHACNI